MNAGGYGQGKGGGRSAHQQGHRLNAVAHDELGLGVGARFLMEGFDSRHFESLLRTLEAIDQNHGAGPHPNNMPGQQPPQPPAPEACERLQVEGVGVEEVKETVIAATAQAQGPQQAGNSGQVGADAKGGHNGGQPKERGEASASGTQR